ncbi:nucleosomal histone kinase 1 [Drosophila grimshawi]|uniref:non-specific serine/threonine protein kinase n=1 Tax=Drosophila grimshawi TaxID=7222 RepID=B4JUF0_DROGR|nr:nucleosomal histone kinase 1 [Drosophila grimshawi]EDV91120.1 GH15905 [Drosophila grimshawi]
MPRAAKPKAAPAKKQAKSKLYAMPEKLKENTILTDLAKGQWRIGPSIGIGGFGEIYAACRNGDKQFDAVVKCEPHGNGPLFVEMHYYLRNAKLEDINNFKRQQSLKSLGMPHILANGSTDINGHKHRFIVMPRYGSDLSKFYVQNGNRLPEATVYRLALQMLDVYQFMHSTGYVHADLKAANILLGMGKGGGSSQAYLVDFGLASHYVTGDFKPDPKKMHNGTIEYTSRDAHLGVATRRADLEILGYNLIEWLGGVLPWVREKLLAVPQKVQKAKEAFMSDVGAALKPLFPQGVPASISEYMKYVAQLKHNEAPDYDKCRKYFHNALKQMRVTNSGDLDFKLKPLISNSSKNNNNSPPLVKKATIKKEASLIVDSSFSDDVILASDDDDENCISQSTPRRKLAAKAKAKASIKQPPTKTTPPIRKAAPKSSTSASPKKREAPRSASPSKRPKLDGNANAKINFSPALSLRAGRAGRAGKTVINDDLTPQPRSNKTYEFNFELDVSMDANVIVNVKRKKKPQQSNSISNTPSTPRTPRTPKTPPTSQPSGRRMATPTTRVNLRKVKGGADGITSPNPSSSSARSPRTPAVTVRKYRR